MQNQNKYIAIGGLIVVLLVGCSKSWLDKKPEAKLAVPTTLKDYQAILDNDAIMNITSPALQEISSDGHYLRELYFPYLNNNERNAYMWTKEFKYNNVPDWANGYKIVFNCNLILEGLDKLSSLSSTQEYKNIKGQALFRRAKIFYELAQVFAPPYQKISANDELGIPTRLRSDINIVSTRPTLQETYSQILNDLSSATEMLPITLTFKTRPSKAAVFALLARIYLSMEEYSLAQENANSCLLLYNTLLDYNTLDSLSFVPMPSYLVNPEIIFSNSLNTYLASANGVFIDTNLYKLYDDNDRRKTVCFTKNIDGSITFKGSYQGFNFGGLAIDEILLIRSECLARANNKEASMADLNALLRKRFVNGTFSNIAATDADDALVHILRERKKELILRGLRWSDLRRLNRDNRFAISLTRSIGGNVYNLEPNSYKYTFPIPDDVIQLSNISQNEGWN